MLVDALAAAVPVGDHDVQNLYEGEQASMPMLQLSNEMMVVMVVIVEVTMVIVELQMVMVIVVVTMVMETTVPTALRCSPASCTFHSRVYLPTDTLNLSLA